MSNAKGTTGMVSPNRKYVQLSVEHVERLLAMFNFGVSEIIHKNNGLHAGQWLDEELYVAITELLEKANENPGARICLAHAVVRGAK
jgi:hypothetical protein